MLFNNSKFQNTQINLTNLVNIEGYAAGQGAHPFVSVVDRLEIAHAVTGKKDKDIAVSALICAANIPDDATELLAILKERIVGGSVTPLKTIIIVSKKFLKLPKKQQLVLLEMEYRKIVPNENIEINSQVPRLKLARAVGGDVSAIQLFGKFAFKRATAKARKTLLKGELALGGALRKDSKRAEKLVKKANKKGLTSVFDQDFSDCDDTLEAQFAKEGC